MLEIPSQGQTRTHSYGMKTPHYLSLSSSRPGATPSRVMEATVVWQEQRRSTSEAVALGTLIIFTHAMDEVMGIDECYSPVFLNTLLSNHNKFP